MQNVFEDVKEFMTVMGQDVPEKPTVSSVTVLRLRADLISEEAKEYRTASGLDENGNVVGEPDLVAMVDAAIDTIYVAAGALIALGVDGQPMWHIVQGTNMAKKDGPRRADGKRLKPPGWIGPEAAIAEEIKFQQDEAPGIRKLFSEL